MIKTGDTLLCIEGNHFYEAGKTYVVGQFVNDRFFELLTGNGDEHWYGTIDNQGIYVHFSTLTDDCGDAWFDMIETQSCA